MPALLEHLDEPGCPAQRLDQGQQAGLVAHPGPGVAVALVADVGPALLDDDRPPGGGVFGQVRAALVGVGEGPLDVVAAVEDDGPAGGRSGRRGRCGRRRLERVGQPRRRPVGGGALVGHRRAVGPLDQVDDDAVGVDGRRGGEPAVAVVDEAARPVGPVGQDDRPGQPLGGPVAGLGQADGLGVVGRVDGEELPTRRPVGVGGVEEADDPPAGGELERGALGDQDGDGGGQHVARRRPGGRDVELPALLRRAGPDRGGEGPRPLDREPPLGTGRRQEGAGGDGEVVVDQLAQGGNVHGERNRFLRGEQGGSPASSPVAHRPSGPSRAKYRDGHNPSTVPLLIPAGTAPKLTPQALPGRFAPGRTPRTSRT